MRLILKYVLLIAVTSRLVCQGKKLPIRIKGGPNELEGRVEIYFKGIWGSVCDDDWDINDGHVVCRMLGHRRALRVSCCSKYGPSSSGRLFLDDVRCTGREDSLIKCRTRLMGTHNCDVYRESAGVVCQGKSMSSLRQIVRLAGGPASHEGRVEIFHDGEWGAVCDDKWDIKDGHVICSMLGFGLAISVSCCSQYGISDSKKIWLDDVRCKGHEKSILSCAKREWGQHNCNNEELAGLVCKEPTEMSQGLIFRLAGGRFPHEGRVEVLHNGIWGAVCDDYWKLRNGHVICRYLGYKRAQSISCCSKYGPSLSTQLWLDDVDCKGREYSLMSCQHRFFGTHNCDTLKETAGVVCDKETLHTEPPPITCPNGFQPSKDGSNCTDIDECQDNTHKCIHQCVNTIGGYKCTCPPGYQGNGQDCEGKSTLTASESKGIRLMDGQGPHEGRVEVWKDGFWGTICDDYWDPRDGNVVCRMLGYRRVKMVTRFTSFRGNHSRKMMLDDVACEGDEDSFFSCSHRGWGVHNCDEKTEEAGVICTNAREPTPAPVLSSRTKFRLAGGRTPNEGRVEIFYRNQWGAVCDDSWKLRNGHVICRQLGYDRAMSVSCCSMYGPIKGGVYWMDDVRCKGKEKSLLECRRREWGRNDCNKEETAGVVCYRPGLTLPTGAIPTSSPTLRIAGGPNPHEGRVEVFKDGQWGGVCHKGWELRDGDVFCRSLGYQRASSVSCCSEYGPSTSGQIWLTDLRCQGYERTFDDCSSRRREYYECSPYDLAGVKCLFGSVTVAPTSGIPNIKVRLVGGYFPNEGAVKVLYGKEWGAVCDDNWGIKEGNVVCRMLGYKRARSVSCCSKYSAVRSGRIWLDDVDCQGTEDTLAKCTHAKWGNNNCNLNELAGVVCHTDNPPVRASVVYPPPVKVRLSGGRYPHMGRVEVLYRGEWGAVCDDLWELKHGHVVCRMLGYKRAVRVSCCSKYGPSVSKKIWLDDIRCRGNERSLMNCTRLPLGQHNCNNKETAGVACEVAPQSRITTVATIAATRSSVLGRPDVQEKTSPPLSPTSPITVGLGSRNVRIVGSSKFWEGRAEIRHNGKWGAICGTSWNLQAGHVFCRMMGFGRAKSVSCCSKYGPHWTFNMLLDGIRCTGNERSILDCAHKRLGIYSCNAKTQAAGVVCGYGERQVLTPVPRTTSKVPSRGKRIRLVGGKTQSEGRVEIFYRGEWGAICDDNWSLNNGHVVCRMLGYSAADNVSCCDSYPAMRPRRIWMDDVTCMGTEKSLFSCRRRDWGQHNCNLNELAGVACMLRPRSTPTPAYVCGDKPEVPVRFGASLNGQKKEPSEPGHWPWQALIMNRRGFKFCTGALVGYQWVLTAAHCFDRVRRPREITIRLGAFKMSPTSFRWLQDISPTAVYRHPLYGRPVGYSNDLVLIKLSRRAIMNRRVGPVCLTNNTKLFTQGTNCWTSGWGFLLNPSLRSSVLQQLPVTIQPLNYCRNYRRRRVHGSMICAGNSGRGSDSCSGDSGGPMVCKNEGRWYLNGLSSYGGDCKRNGRYALYSNAPNLIKWAYDIMDRYS